MIQFSTRSQCRRFVLDQLIPKIARNPEIAANLEDLLRPGSQGPSGLEDLLEVLELRSEGTDKRLGFNAGTWVIKDDEFPYLEALGSIASVAMGMGSIALAPIALISGVCTTGALLMKANQRRVQLTKYQVRILYILNELPLPADLQLIDSQLKAINLKMDPNDEYSVEDLKKDLVALTQVATNDGIKEFIEEAPQGGWCPKGVTVIFHP